jgi:hypothetical protein
MAFVTPTDVTVGSVLTASKYNQEVVENVKAIRGDFATSRYTAGDIALNSVTWANWPAGPADLVLAADTGDLIEVALSAVSSTEAVTGYLDVVTMVGAVVTNSFAEAGAVNASGTGISAWFRPPSAQLPVSGSFFYKLVAGDISASTVTLRLRARTSAAANKTIFANTNTGVVFFARNHGPVEI